MSNTNNKEVIVVEPKDAVKWCDEQLEKAISSGRTQEAEAYERLKHLWEDISARKKPVNG